jgi:DNA-binding MarR family transcriptional regulator
MPDDARLSTREDELQRMQAAMQEFMARAVLFQDAVARAGGLSSVDMQVVSILMSEGPATPGELAERTGLTRGGSITSTIDRLEQLGYVVRERDQDDRRRVRVKPVIETVMTRVGPIYGRITSRWAEYLAGISDEQLRFANDLLEHAARINKDETARLRLPEN